MANKEVKPVQSALAINCKICNVTVHPGNEESHRKGRKHQFLDKLRQSYITRPTRWIHVTELPVVVGHFDVTEYFSTFGEMTSSYFPKNKPYCFLEFATPVNKLQLFKQQHWLADQEIIIKKIPSSVSKAQFSKNIFDGPNILEKISHKATIENQIENFIQKSLLTEEEILHRECFVALLTSTLQDVFPGSRLEILGSTANGMAFSGADLDLSLFLPFEREENDIVNLETSNMPAPQDVIMGKFIPENLTHLSSENILYFLSKYLLYLPGFKSCLIKNELGFSAIYFMHGPTSLKCFLSLNKSLGLANTQLLHLYGQLDFYVYALLMVLRFWGKRERFVGTGQGKISGYAFNWLVIFYLQKKNLVPTVQKLSELSDLTVEAEDWDCSFTEDVEIIPVKTKDKSFGELITGFFEFYSKLDFTSFILCPRDGTLISKPELRIEAGNNLDFTITDMSVQDVFDMTHNITQCVNVETINRFHSRCGQQLIIWQDMIKHRKVCLKTLFDDTPLKEAGKANFVQSNFVHVSLQSHDLGLAYYDVDEVCNFILDIFKRVLLFKCKIIRTSSELKFDNRTCSVMKLDENPSKRPKAGENAEKFLLEVSCEICHRVWQGRKKYQVEGTVPAGLQRLDYEETISKETLKDSTQPETLLHSCDVKISLWKEDNKLQILFIPKSQKNELGFTVIPFVKKLISELSETALKAYLTR